MRGFYPKMRDACSNLGSTWANINNRTFGRRKGFGMVALNGVPLVGDATYDDGPTAAAARMMLHAWKLRVPLPEGRRLVARSRDPFPIRGGRLRPRVDPGLGHARIV